MVSDLKSDLVMMSYQQRPNVHLIGNPAVCPYGGVGHICCPRRVEDIRLLGKVKSVVHFAEIEGIILPSKLEGVFSPVEGGVILPSLF